MDDIDKAFTYSKAVFSKPCRACQFRHLKITLVFTGTKKGLEHDLCHDVTSQIPNFHKAVPIPLFTEDVNV